MPSVFVFRRLGAIAAVLFVLTALSITGNMSLSAGATPMPTVMTVDDSVQGAGQNQFNYSGGWQRCTGCGSTFYQQTRTWSSTGGDTATLRFTGSQVRFYGGMSPHGGQGILSIDGSELATVDFYSPVVQGNILLWTSADLGAGPHTLMLRVTGSKNPGSLGTEVSVDRADVITTGKATVQPTQPCLPQPGQAPTFVPARPNSTIAPIPTRAVSPCAPAGSPSAVVSPTFTALAPLTQSSQATKAAPKALAASAAQVILVTSAADPANNSGACPDAVNCTLRQAIKVAQEGDTIQFDPSLSGAIITLHGPIGIWRGMTIDGSAAPGLAIDGGISGQLMLYIGANNVVFANLTIQNANVPDNSGGAIDNYSGQLTILNSILANNSARDGGGAIYNGPSGSLTIENSTFTGNFAKDGAAIYSYYGGVINITNSTFSGNISNGVGGGTGGAITNDGTMTITSSTFAGNSTQGYAGGILAGGPTTIQSSIVADNTDASGPDDVGGTITSLGFNLFGTSANLSGLVSTDQHDLDPLLGPLADNGGSTRTMALEKGSPAIGAGGGACPATDQRGMARQNPCDAGAYENHTPPGPISALTSTINLTPARVAADGQDVMTMTVTARDSNGQLLADTPITITLANPAFVFDQTSGSTDASGVFTAHVTSAETRAAVAQVSSGDTLLGSPILRFIGADPAVKIYGLPTILAGQNVVYALVVTNAGLLPSHTISMLAGLPLGAVTFESQTPPTDVQFLGQSGNRLNWVVPLLQPGESRTILMVGRSNGNIQASTPLVFGAQVASGDDSNVGNNEDQFTTRPILRVPPPTGAAQSDKLSVALTIQEPTAVVGATVTLRMTVKNITSAENLYNVQGFAALRGTIPDVQLTWPDATHPGRLQPGESATGTFPYVIPPDFPTTPSGPIFEAWASAADSDPSDGYLVANVGTLDSSATTITGPGIMVSISPSESDAAVGDTVTFTATVSNSGYRTDSATGLTLFDELTQQNLTLPLTTLAPGDTTQESFTYPTTAADIPQIVDRETVTGAAATSGLPVTATGRVAISVGTPTPGTPLNLSLDTSTEPPVFLPNLPVKFPVVVKTNGAAPAVDVTARMLLPAGVDVKDPASGTYDAAAHQITWTYASLTQNTTVTPLLQTADPLGTQLTFDLSVGSATPESDLTDNVASVTLNVVQQQPTNAQLVSLNRAFIVADNLDSLTLQLTALDQLGNPMPDVTAQMLADQPGVTLGLASITTNNVGVATDPMLADQVGPVTISADLGSGIIASTQIMRQAGPLQLDNTNLTVGIGGSVNDGLLVVNPKAADTYSLSVTGTNGFNPAWAQFQPTSLPLATGQFTASKMVIAVPGGDCTLAKTYDLTVAASGVNGALGTTNATLIVTAAPPALTDILPAANAAIGNPRVFFSWRSNTPGPATLYLRPQGSTSYTAYKMISSPKDATLYIPDPTVPIPALKNGVYEWYGTLTSACNQTVSTGSDAAPNVFSVTQSVSFVDAGYDFTIHDDYDQTTDVNGVPMIIHIINRDPAQSHTVVVKLNSPYADLIAGFIGSGSLEQTQLLTPGQAVDLPLHVFTQETTQSQYGLTVSLATQDKSNNSTDSVPLTLTIQQPVFNVSLDNSATDPNTRVTAGSLTNHGDTVTELDFDVLNASGVPANVVVFPDIHHVYLPKGSSIPIRIVPMDLADGVGFSSAAVRKPLSTLAWPNKAAPDSAAPAGPYLTHICAHGATCLPPQPCTDNRCSPGLGAFAISASQDTTIEASASSWYCTNRPNIDVSLRLPILLAPDSLIEAITVESNFAPGSAEVYNHSTALYFNGQFLGEGIVPQQPVLTFSAPVSAWAGNFAAQVIRLNSIHTSSAHYVIASNFQMKVRVSKFTCLVCAANLASAQQLCQTTADPRNTTDPLAFVSDKDGPDQIYLSFGTQPAKNLTNNAAAGTADTYPALSPDGQTLAYVSTTNNVNGIYLTTVGTPTNSGGGAPILVYQNTIDTKGNNALSHPSLNQNGDVAFAQIISGKSAIYVAKRKSDGTYDNAQPITTNSNVNYTWPVFVPNSNQIVFVSDQTGHQAVYMMNADGANLSPLILPKNVPTSPTDVTQPAVSSDGHLAFTAIQSPSQSFIWTTNLNNTGPLTQLTTAAQGSFPDSEPAWSFDSSQVAFTSTQPGQKAIFVINSDGSHRQQYLNDTNSDSTLQGSNTRLPSWNNQSLATPVPIPTTPPSPSPTNLDCSTLAYDFTQSQWNFDKVWGSWKYGTGFVSDSPNGRLAFERVAFPLFIPEKDTFLQQAILDDIKNNGRSISRIQLEYVPVASPTDISWNYKLVVAPYTPKGGQILQQGSTSITTEEHNDLNHPDWFTSSLDIQVGIPFGARVEVYHAKSTTSGVIVKKLAFCYDPGIPRPPKPSGAEKACGDLLAQIRGDAITPGRRQPFDQAEYAFTDAGPNKTIELVPYPEYSLRDIANHNAYTGYPYQLAYDPASILQAATLVPCVYKVKDTVANTETLYYPPNDTKNMPIVRFTAVGGTADAQEFLILLNYAAYFSLGGDRWCFYGDDVYENAGKKADSSNYQTGYNVAADRYPCDSTGLGPNLGPCATLIASVYRAMGYFNQGAFTKPINKTVANELVGLFSGTIYYESDLAGSAYFARPAQGSFVQANYTPIRVYTLDDSGNKRYGLSKIDPVRSCPDPAHYLDANCAKEVGLVGWSKGSTISIEKRSKGDGWDPMAVWKQVKPGDLAITVIEDTEGGVTHDNYNPYPHIEVIVGWGPRESDFKLADKLSNAKLYPTWDSIPVAEPAKWDNNGQPLYVPYIIDRYALPGTGRITGPRPYQYGQWHTAVDLWVANFKP